MQPKIKIHHLFLIGALALGSCQKEYVKPIPVTPPPTVVHYGTDIAPTFATSCALTGCHGAGDNSPDLSSAGAAYTSLTTGTAQTSTATGPYVNVANPASSVFYIRIHNTTPDTQMPQGAGALGSTYQAAVLKWIQDGALHN